MFHKKPVPGHGAGPESSENRESIEQAARLGRAGKVRWLQKA